MAIKYLSKAKKSGLAGTALLRLDFNTEDDWRMRAALPTIKFLLKNSKKIIIVSHRGRPKNVTLKDGTPQDFEKKLSLKKDAAALAKMLGSSRVTFINHFRFEEIRRKISKAPAGSIFLLENMRFLKGEEADDPKLGRQLASLADFYVNDAFAVSHRANASVTAVPQFLPSYAGLELEKEITSLSGVMKKPGKPLVLILGGAKASDKLGVLKYFSKRADKFLLGGGCANTALFIRGVDIKKSLRDDDPADLREMKKIIGEKGSAFGKTVLPDDFIWGGDRILDLGLRSSRHFAELCASAGTIVWSGPLGLVEKPRYSKASIAVARAIGRSRAFSLVGGGETVMFLKKYGLDRKIGFISTGGGAMLDYLAGKRLPGIAALM